MKTLNLNGRWNIREVGGKLALTGNVPGVVHHDMIMNKMVEEPNYRDNEEKQQWVGDKTWEYTREFKLTQSQIEAPAVILDCEGLDTLADTYVNGMLVAKTDNMFIRERFDVKKHVKPGTNTIRIIFHPVRPEMQRRSDRYFINIEPGVERPWQPKPRNFVRKAACHRGWDWGPAFLVQGIWRDITLDCFSGCRLLYATHAQSHSKNKVTVKITAYVEAARECGTNITFTLGSEKTNRFFQLVKGMNKATASITMDNPKLWWPNGLGKPSLYPLTMTATTEGESDTLKQNIGLRTLELVTEKDKAGESFFFRVNGVPVFAKGANWIPSDSFDSRLTDDQVRWELSSAAKANHNCVRVWGGGIYERDHFYDTCDKLGLLVWQDLMFACALFPTTPSFLQSVSREVRHQVRRLQHHASIALWCGNNENEQALRWTAKDDRDRMVTLAAEYDRLYMGTIAPVLATEDPTRRYWPSSPCNGAGRYGEPNDQTMGDVHFWKVWHGNEPFTIYQKVNPRFCSEFGFQSFSSPESMDAAADKSDRNICSPVFEFHQRSGVGNQKILDHICRQFRMPVGYENMLYVSQALQALSIQAGVEHWRRIKPLNMGAIYWQLNDIWPCASWSSLEYDGRWKLLHYASRKFYSPLLVSTVEKDGKLECWATSDINAPLSGQLTATLHNSAGKVLRRYGTKVSLKRLESRKALVLPLANLFKNDAEKADRFIQVALKAGSFESCNHHFFAAFKALSLKAPKIQCRVKAGKNGSFLFTLKSDVFAPFVWIRTGKTMGVFSDNGMHLMPGKAVKLTFTPRTPVSLTQLKKAVKVHDLYTACV